MWYVLALIVVFAYWVVGRLVARQLKGRRALRAVMGCEARPGSPEALFVDWLKADPRRLEQKGIFVAAMEGLRVPEPRCGWALLQCIRHSWGADGKPFGEVLGAELERQLNWPDPAGDPARIEVQREGREALAALEAKLVALD